MSRQEILADIQWNEVGLVPVIAQDAETGQVLMLAWMSPESLNMTIEEGVAVYWSRSRKALWKKGQSSGQIQKVLDIRLDCDKDALLLKVEQTGVACHTGRRSCFFEQLQGDKWVVVDPVLVDPADLY